MERSEKEIADAATTVALWLASVRFEASRKCDMNPRDYLVMEAVVGRGEMPSMQELARLLGKDVSSCGRNVKKLVEKQEKEEDKKPLLVRCDQATDGHIRARVRATSVGLDRFSVLQNALCREIKQARASEDERARKKLDNALRVLQKTSLASSRKTSPKGIEDEPQRSSIDDWAYLK